MTFCEPTKKRRIELEVTKRIETYKLIHPDCTQEDLDFQRVFLRNQVAVDMMRNEVRLSHLTENLLLRKN